MSNEPDEVASWLKMLLGQIKPETTPGMPASRVWTWKPDLKWGKSDLEQDMENVVEADGFHVLPTRLLPEKASDA